MPSEHVRGGEGGTPIQGQGFKSSGSYAEHILYGILALGLAYC